MSRLKKIIYKFLDEYIGDGVKVKNTSTPVYNLYAQTWKIKKDTYSLYSDKGILILTFKVCKNDSIDIFRGLELCNMICRYFSLGDDEAMRYVNNWFADKHNMKKASDLLKFIPEPLSCA
jgi:hypothetical protein